MSIATSSTRFRYVEEQTDEFLALFPHRFDYIYAKHPPQGQKPAWRTESRHPLADRLINQGAHLFGVRFSKQTRYSLLDIDIGSQYHPNRDPFAISNLIAALEPLGLSSYIACTSSYSGGIHLYFPLNAAHNSWELATAIVTQLEQSGFTIAPGQLEVFPNPRPYSAGAPSLFNAHRLPLQMGSYLLNQDFQPIWSNRTLFVQQWRFAQTQNSLNSCLLKRLLRQAKRRADQVSGRAEKFLQDLTAEIEQGWTGLGQTNRLLGRIAMRTYVFHHILFGGQPLIGQALVNEIVAIARSLPGYQDWCQHQPEIEKRASEWARCVENSRYFPYGLEKLSSKAPAADPGSGSATTPSWNQRQSLATREKIRLAIANLLETNSLPVGVTDRFRLLTRCGIGGSSLYRHRDLWHPEFLSSNEMELNGDRLKLGSELEPEVESADDRRSAPLNDLEGDLIINPWIDPELDLTIDQFTDQIPDLTDYVSAQANSQGFVRRDQKNLEADQDHQSGQCPIASSTSLLAVIGCNLKQHQDSSHSLDQNLLPVGCNSLIDRNINDPSVISRSQVFQMAVENLEKHQAPQAKLSQLCQEFPAFTEENCNRQDDQDYSALLVAIAIEVRRLGWSRAQISQQLWFCFGKRRQAMLLHCELLQWLEWLREQC
ncbi:MAG: hypothetical protein Kow00121_38350 [Elainellaceae cyanobacterium]